MLFLFFSILGEWDGWVLESMENSIHIFLNPSHTANIGIVQSRGPFLGFNFRHENVWVVPSSIFIIMIDILCNIFMTRQ